MIFRATGRRRTGSTPGTRSRRSIAEDGVAVVLVAIGIIFVHERRPFLDGRVLLPRGIAGVLQERGRDHADGVLKARRSQRAGNRSRALTSTNTGCQSSSAALRMARAAIGGAQLNTRISAPEFLRMSTWYRSTYPPRRRCPPRSCWRCRRALPAIPETDRARTGRSARARRSCGRDRRPGCSWRKSALGAERRLPAHGPRKLFRMRPLLVAGGNEELRDLSLVEIGRVARLPGVPNEPNISSTFSSRPDRASAQSPSRIGAVVEGDEFDLSSVDAAALVDHVEIGGLRPADGGKRSQRPGIGHDVADADFIVRPAGIGSLLGSQRKAREERCDEKAIAKA